MMLHTRLCELLNIEVPVLGTPMGPDIAGLDLAAAASTAAGLRIVSCGAYLKQLSSHSRHHDRVTFSAMKANHQQVSLSVHKATIEPNFENRGDFNLNCETFNMRRIS